MVEIYGEQEKTHYQNDRILGSVLKQQPAQQTNKKDRNFPKTMVFSQNKNISSQGYEKQFCGELNMVI